MATTMTVSPVNYIGEATSEYLLKCMDGNKTGLAGVRFEDSVKFKINLKKLDASDLLVPATCDESFNGNIVASACDYEVKEVQSVIRICWKDVPQLFGSEKLTAGVNNGNINQVTDFTPAMLDIMTNKIGESVDEMLWTAVLNTGGTGTTDLFDGYIPILVSGGCAGETGNNITGTTASAITTSNVIAVFGAVYEYAPSCVMNKAESELVYFVSPRTKALLKLAYSVFENIMPLGTIASTFLGIEVVAIPTIPDDVVILGERKNFVIITDLFSDFNSISILDERPRYNFVLFILRAKLTAGIGFPSEVTTWGLA
jgi:hypothetical protein